MPIVNPEPKHRYTAKIEIIVEHGDPVRAFQVATELVQRIGAGTYGQVFDGVIYSHPRILQAEVERIEPPKPGGAS